MNRYRIELDASLDPPFCLIPDPLGVVVLAEAALTRIREAAQTINDAGNLVIAAAERSATLDEVAAWLCEQGRPKTAEAMLAHFRGES